MSKRYGVIVHWLGGLTPAALMAQSDRKVLLIERNASAGGAASIYKVGDLVVKASLHETSDPHNPADPKHHVLARLGVLDAIERVPVGPFYEVRGGPVGGSFVLADSFAGGRRCWKCTARPAAMGARSRQRRSRCSTRRRRSSLRQVATSLLGRPRRAASPF